jgi:hypothetical protein
MVGFLFACRGLHFKHLLLLGVKETRQPGTMSNGQFWIYNVLDTIASLEKDSKHVRPIREADAQEQAIRKRARSTIEAMKVVRLIESCPPGVELISVD